MSEERQAAEYLAVLREHNEIADELTALKSRLHRIGNSFIGLGKRLVEDPSVVPLDEAAFKADVSDLPGLLRRYTELSLKQAEKKSALEKSERFKPPAS